MKKLIDRFPNTTELAFLVFVFAASLFIFVGAFDFRGPARSFPIFTSLSTLILTVAYAVKLYRATDTVKKTPPTAEERADARSSLQKVTTTLVCFVAYIILAYLFGFLVASAVIGLFYPLLHGYRSVLGVAMSLVFNVGIVLVFQQVLGVPLSRGLLLDMTRLFY